MKKMNKANLELLDRILDITVSNNLIKDTDILNPIEDFVEVIDTQSSVKVQDFQEAPQDVDTSGLKMEHQVILEVIKEKLKQYPELRFTQVLQILNINIHITGEDGGYIVDNFYDTDSQIIERMGS